MGDKVEPVKIEDVAKALGAEVRVSSSFSQKQLFRALQELKNIKGSKVLISRGECRLLTKRKFRAKGITMPIFKINQKECTKCGVCTSDFACPAIIRTMKFNVMLTGVGGEGVLTTQVMIARAANIEGHYVRGVQLHGLAQRGGTIPAFVRFGSEEEISSPAIMQADAGLMKNDGFP